MFKLFAKKSLGQNFLANPGVIERIVAVADISPEDTVLEIGPGTGLLTKALLTKTSKVLAIEKDARAIENLKKEFPAARIIEEDVLEFKPNGHGLVAGRYKIVANLPYYITSHFIRTVLEEWPRPKLLVLMVQKEVAQRIISKPPNMNLLALSVQYFAKPEIIMYVSPGSFRPSPSVASAIIKLMPHQKPRVESQEKRAQLFKIARAAFSGKRKQLINTLPPVIGLSKEVVADLLRKFSIEPESRPETLSLDDWLHLVDNISI